MSSSPCPGVTLRRIPGSGVPVARVHYIADPTMTEARAAELRRKYTSDARWRREMEIEYEALEGERYIPEYVPEMNDCDPFDVSDRELWTIWQGADPHMRTPHAFLWLVVNKHGDHVVCGELWPGRQFTVREYAETVDWLESDSEEKPLAWEWANGKKLKVHFRVMDTHGAAANSDEGIDYFAAYRQYGLHFYPAKKSQAILESARDSLGMALLPERITVGEESFPRPRERVFRTCQEFRNELENVRYPEGDVERPSQEKPLTYRKHLIDCRLYIETHQPRFVLPRRGGNAWKPIYPATGY